MSTTTLIIFVAVLVATVIVNDLTLTITMKKKIEELKIERANLNFSLIQNFKMYFDGVRKKEQQDTEFIAEITKQNDILKEQYEALDEAYDHMNSRYMEICEHYSKLLTCWAGVEERYSDCYEQLKYQNERFDKIEKFIDEWNQNVWHPEEYIDMDISSLVGGESCKYNCAGICQNEDCPAFKAYCPIDDPRVCRYSNINGLSDDLSENVPDRQPMWDSKNSHLSRTEREIKEFEGTTCDFNKEGICKNKNCKAGDTLCPYTNPMECGCGEVTISYGSNIDVSKLKHKACTFENEGICRHPEFISPMVGQECPFLNPESCRYYVGD